MARKKSPATKKPAKKAKPKSAGLAYQFKITLLGAQPPIWRRIQVNDCTLDKLHEHIQTAMGWTNSHLHHFVINRGYYADPMLMQESFVELDYKDSTTTKLSDILPQGRKRLGFVYEYDFGDSWQHEVRFEGSPEPEAGAQYPLCLEGERACPPEDVGGVWGYADFLAALADPKHEEHDDYMEWAGQFDPQKFSPAQATKAMRKGLPDWRL